MWCFVFLAHCLSYPLYKHLKTQVMKNNKKTNAVQLMLNGSLEAYLLYIQQLTFKAN